MRMDELVRLQKVLKGGRTTRDSTPDPSTYLPLLPINHMSNYHLHYSISERTPPSPKVLRSILDTQTELNARLTWTNERLALVARRDLPRPTFAFPYVRFASVRTVPMHGLETQQGCIATLIPSGAYAAGSTKVRDSLWNAHLVAAFLRNVSARHPELLFELRDDGGFVLPGAVWIQGGKVELNRDWLNHERERALEATGSPEAAEFYVWAETQALGGRFFEEGNVFDHAEVEEIRELGASWNQLESSSLEDIADIVVKRATSPSVPQVA
jgi:hypothetical protein